MIGKEMVAETVASHDIIRHGAKMLHVMSAATVPKIAVVVRKAYGAGYYVMCGRAYEPDLIVGWPTADIAARKLFGDTEPTLETKKTMAEQIQKYIDVYKVAGWGLIDDPLRVFSGGAVR